MTRRRIGLLIGLANCEGPVPDSSKQAPAGDSKNPTLSTIATEIHAREVVRCRSCLLVQFRTLSDLCRRCAQALPSPPRLDAPVNGGLDGLRSTLAGATAITADRSLSGDGLRLRGKTAREFTIGRRLRELREQRSLTQQEMAVKAGVPRTYISRIENARLLPGPLMLRRIADALAVEILDMLPQSKNGNHHGDPELEALWEPFARHFLLLGPQEMSRVVSFARNLVDEGRTERAEAHLAVV